MEYVCFSCGQVLKGKYLGQNMNGPYYECRCPDCFPEVDPTLPLGGTLLTLPCDCLILFAPSGALAYTLLAMAL